jgi:threonine dehydratase
VADAADRDVPRVDDDADVAFATVGRVDHLAALELDDGELVVEPSGALTVAAVAFRSAEAGLDDLDGPIVAVVSGGNVDPDLYRVLLASPLPDPP